VESIHTEHRDTFVLEGRICDSIAAATSNEVDVPRDRAWFARHPGRNSYVRKASESEIQAVGLPENAVAEVRILPDGGLARSFRPRTRGEQEGVRRKGGCS